MVKPNQTTRRRKGKVNKKSTEEPTEPTEQEMEDARRLRKLLDRSVPTHLVVGAGTSIDDDVHALSIIQTIIDRRIKLLSNKNKNRTLTFVVLSTSNLSSTISLSPAAKTGEPTVVVRPLKNDIAAEKEEDEPFHIELIHQLSIICNDQFERKLNRNLHGIFIHCGTDKQNASSLLAMLQCFFLDNQPGIRRLDLQGVITIIRPDDVTVLDSKLCALTDRFVLATQPHIVSHEQREGAVQSEEIAAVEDATIVLRRRNPRAEIVEGEIGMNKLLVLDPEATQIVDEIFAYSRFLCTQLFPDDDDLQRPAPLSKKNDASTSMETGVLVVLPNHRSVEIAAFHFWMESLLTGKEGTNIIRVKGLLAMRGSRQKYILQCVGQSFGVEESHEQFWNQSRRCTLLFIGENLDGRKLKQELMHCLAQEGFVEKWYWWADAHCCVLALALILLSMWGGLLFMASIDYGYLDLRLWTAQ